MATQKITPDDVATVPADSPETPKAEHPTKGRRFRLFKGGDVLVVKLVGADDPSMPAGSMVPIEGVPQFEDVSAAKKWIRNDSGDLLQGMTVMVVWAKARMAIEVQSKPAVVITEAPRHQVAGPEAE